MNYRSLTGYKRWVAYLTILTLCIFILYYVGKLIGRAAYFLLN